MTISADEAKALLDAATPGPWKQGRTPKVSREEQRAHLDSGTCECHDSWDQCPCAECGHFAGCDCCPLGTGLCGPRDMPWVDASSAMCFIDVDPELSDDGNGGINDASLIAAAPDLAATVIELQARIDKVLALHAKTTEKMLDNRCANEVCEHEDECPSIFVDVCSCCAEIAQQVSDEYWPAAMDEITWPCPTVRALTQGGEQ